MSGDCTLPPVVALMVTGACESRCRFCFGPPRSTPSLDLDAWRGILQFLRRRGVHALLVSGGEPLLRPDLDEILRFARGCGFRTSLATSCPTLDGTRAILPLVDWCEISLHGSTSAVHASIGRTEDNFEIVLGILAYLTTRLAPRVKVNTVVTPANAGDLSALARLLAGFRLDTWKLSEVRPRGAAFENLVEMHYAFRSHGRALEAVRTQGAQLMPSTRIVVSPSTNGDKAYVVVDPDGRVLIPDGDRYLEAGNLGACGAWQPAEEESFVQMVVRSVDSSRVAREFEAGFERLA